jgi:LPS sulfotransferase NodH
VARPKRQPVYSRPFIEEQLGKIAAANDNWAQYFAAHQIEVFPLWYEDLESDVAAAVLAIARFAGGESLEREVNGSPPFVEGGRFVSGLERQRTSLNDEWRHRFETSSN